MKLRIKASKQDWMVFGAFSLVLLYCVCIIVININSFASSGTFAGLNPFLAFSGEYIAATFVLFILALVFLFATVSSHFFDRESGFGVGVGAKNTKGYSRWAVDAEAKETLKKVSVKDPSYQHAGFPIINNGKTMWVDDGESHNLVIGSTGTGKTQCIIHPLVKILAKKGESMVITDPKAEIYHESAGLLKQRGYKIVVLNFREPQRGNTWNPLALPHKYYKEGNVDKAMELLDDVSSNILYEEGGSKDVFWEKTSADYFAGLTLGLFDDAAPEEVNINSISVMTSVGEDRFGPRSTYVKEYFNRKDPASAAYTCAASTIMAADETKASILATFKQKIRMFASRENLSEMLSNSDFDISNIGKQRTAVFLVIQDEKKTYHALATIFIKQCYETLIDTAQNSPGGKLPVRTNFILDEFANMPPFKDITTMITAARSRLIRFTMIIQNFAQLDSVYGDKDAQTIRSNCNNLLYLLTTELSALKEISELCGEIKVKVGSGEKEHEETRPLVSVTELQQMRQFEAIVIRTRLRPYRTKLKANFEMDWGLPPRKADPFITREKKPIKTFDLKKFVTENENNRMKGMFDNQRPGGGFASPFGSLGGGANANPFINQPSPPINQPLDMDDFVKKIDQKIAALEAEEKAKKDKPIEDKKAVDLADKPKENLIIKSDDKETIALSEALKNKEVKTPDEPIAIKPSPVEEIKPLPELQVVKPAQVNQSDSSDQFIDEFFTE